LSTVSISSPSPRHEPDSDNSLNGKDADIARNSSYDKNESLIVHFAYDGDGNRIGESVTRDNKTESTQYLWNVNTGLPQILTESDGKESALYTYGLQRISTTDPRGEQTYYQYDGLGSVRSLSDSRGNTEATYSYDAFGEPLPTTGPGDNEFLFGADDHSNNDFLYRAEQMDSETGLMYLRARYYDPSTGRFITRDSFPAEETLTQGINRYVYTGNNPVNRIDPSGMCSSDQNTLASGMIVGSFQQQYNDYNALRASLGITEGGEYNPALGKTILGPYTGGSDSYNIIGKGSNSNFFEIDQDYWDSLSSEQQIQLNAQYVKMVAEDASANGNKIYITQLPPASALEDSTDPFWQTTGFGRELNILFNQYGGTISGDAISLYDDAGNVVGNGWEIAIP
jgi:RHS repeat-associated protein